MIGGTQRRRELKAPRVKGLRPTSDRVREAMFDILASLGAVEGSTVLDLFAGSGALGIEALSRGAESAVFVDDDRRCLDAVRANLAATGFDVPGRSRVVLADAPALVERGALAHVDLALVDPPYRFEEWPRLLGSLDADLAVLESSSEVPAAGGFRVRRVYRYGGTLVTLVEAIRTSDANPKLPDEDPF